MRTFRILRCRGQQPCLRAESQTPVTPYREVNHGELVVVSPFPWEAVHFLAANRDMDRPMSGRNYCWPASLVLAFV
jgi:hypothetical protein